VGEYIIPPIINCLGEWLTTEWSAANQTIANRTNTSVFVTDWGGESAFRWVDTGIFGHPLIPSFVHALDYFHDQGSVSKEDLWGAPYDWRGNPVFIDGFLDAYQRLIDEIYDRTE
jgi:lecithin-cholesterol acyltransferase